MHEGEQSRADAADAMTDDELETAIAALHTRERAFLVAGDVAAASNLVRTKFGCSRLWRGDVPEKSEKRSTSAAQAPKWDVPPSVKDVGGERCRRRLIELHHGEQR